MPGNFAQQADQILVSTGRIKAFAEQKRWPQFSDESAQYVQALNHLIADIRKETKPDTALIPLLQRIIIMDREVHALINARMQEIAFESGKTRRAQRSVKAYDAV